jgi:ferrous iron transport protein A
MRINMRKMHDNQAGTISSIKVAGELGRRLRDMGLVPGTEIKIQGRTCSGDRNQDPGPSPAV